MPADCSPLNSNREPRQPGPLSREAMPLHASNHAERLSGHALRNAHLRQRALARAETVSPLARLVVKIRAETLGLTRLELARRSGIGRGTLRDLELGVHKPTRRILRQFVAFCQHAKVGADQLDELHRLYAGPGETLEQIIARLELRAGSPRELARRVGISPATLWEYRRGNFPLPLDLLRRLCQAVGENAIATEALWYETQRRRLLERGYPEALAEFWTRCARQGYAERQLLLQGVLSTATVRQLRYLELPPWSQVEQAVRLLSQGDEELKALKRLWLRDEHKQRLHDRFGPDLKRLRQTREISRREIADLFGVGGKKPARIIKYIEEDGFYSAKAYPAGLVAILTDDESERGRLLEHWHERRRQFHRRHRPEMRTELRLAREVYGFELRDMQPILGYSSAEYQRIERGVTPLLPTAVARILEAIHQAGQRRVVALLQRQNKRTAERSAWQTPPSVADMITLLARRERGLIPLTRLLRKAGLKGLWTGRLRAIARGEEIPTWKMVEQIGRACGVEESTELRRDWSKRYRARLQAQFRSPLAVELRLLIAEAAVTLRGFSPRLGFNYSVLIRDLQRIDIDQPVKWFHIERILRASNLSPDEERWREIHALWYTTKERNGRAHPLYRPHSNGTSGR
ncbi:MAG TPA: helix-turn-helix transcriptional regulator [Gemmataceae bacterium]|nr:helix-turn-helix transcriptional regulator [Gemmataceae bacterium]